MNHTTINDLAKVDQEVLNQMKFIQKKFDDLKLPKYMWEGVERYIRDGTKCGHFLTAIFSNQFLSVFAHADLDNLAAIKNWARFLNNYIPIGAIGSERAFERWNEGGGLVGVYTRQRKHST